MIDSFGIPQRWISSTNCGTQEFQHRISSLSDIMFSIFWSKISGHVGPHALSSSCKNDLKFISYQIFIVWIFGIFSSCKEFSTIDKYFWCLKCTRYCPTLCQDKTSNQQELAFTGTHSVQGTVQSIHKSLFNLSHSPIRRWHLFLPFEK